MMAVGIITLLVTTLVAIAEASPSSLPMGIEVKDVDGKMVVREVVSRIPFYPQLFERHGTLMCLPSHMNYLQEA